MTVAVRTAGQGLSWMLSGLHGTAQLAIKWAVALDPERHVI
ncbi:hypothetical protein [Acrocarpospora sp. B8E8]